MVGNLLRFPGYFFADQITTFKVRIQQELQAKRFLLAASGNNCCFRSKGQHLAQINRRPGRMFQPDLLTKRIHTIIEG